MIFVDTSGRYAAYVPKDSRYAAVSALVEDSSLELLTTYLVLAETLNLLRARGETERAKLLGRSLLEGAAANMVYLTPADFERAFVLFSTHRDKAWSFIDCTSLVLMQRLGVSEAISLDEHFRQMPGLTVLPRP